MTFPFCWPPIFHQFVGETARPRKRTHDPLVVTKKGFKKYTRKYTHKDTEDRKQELVRVPGVNSDYCDVENYGKILNIASQVQR